MSSDFWADLAKSQTVHRTHFGPHYDQSGYQWRAVEDETLQAHGVDVIAFTPEGEIRFIEEKADFYKPVNFVFETINPNTGNPGWICKKTLTDDYFIYYLFPIYSILYILKYKETKEWFEANGGQYREVRTHNGVFCTLVPIVALPDDCIESIIRLTAQEVECTN